MPITITPTIADITINATTWTNSDWEANTPGTISEVGNAIATQLQALDDTTGSIVKAITGDVTLSGPEAVNLCFIFVGTLSGNATITFPDGERMAVIVNNTDGGYALIIGLSGSGLTVAIPASGSATVYCDGDDFVLADGIARNSSGITVLGTTSIVGAVTLSDSLNVAGPASMATIATSGDIECGEDISIVGTLFVGSDIECSGAVSVDGSLEVTGDIECHEDISATGNFSAGGTISAVGEISGASLKAISDTTYVALSLDAPDASSAIIDFFTGNVLRWWIGRNTDNNFGLAWYNASGVYQNHIFVVDEATGHLRLFNVPTSSSGLDTGTIWSNAGVLTLA